jgi:hypothetical protein
MRASKPGGVFKMKHHETKTLVVSDAIMDAAASAIKAELVYQRATNCGRKFGITGEIGEIFVCRALGLKMVEDPRSEGFDAVDAKGRCVQIKTRRGENGELPKNSGSLSRFSDHECDYVLLGVLSKEYNLIGVWKAEFSRLKPIIGKRKRANPTIRQFKSVGEQVHP